MHRPDAEAEGPPPFLKNTLGCKKKRFIVYMKKTYSTHTWKGEQILENVFNTYLIIVHLVFEKVFNTYLMIIVYLKKCLPRISKRVHKNQTNYTGLWYSSNTYVSEASDMASPQSHSCPSLERQTLPPAALTCCHFPLPWPPPIWSQQVRLVLGTPHLLRIRPKLSIEKFQPW